MTQSQSKKKSHPKVSESATIADMSEMLVNLSYQMTDNFFKGPRLTEAQVQQAAEAIFRHLTAQLSTPNTGTTK